PTPTPAPPPPPPISASPDGWIFSARGLNPANRYPYLGNGYLGLQAGVTGCGWDGKQPLPAFAAGLYVHEARTPLPAPGAVEGRRAWWKCAPAAPSSAPGPRRSATTRRTWLYAKDGSPPAPPGAPAARARTW